MLSHFGNVSSHLADLWSWITPPPTLNSTQCPKAAKKLNKRYMLSKNVQIKNKQLKNGVFFCWVNWNIITENYSRGCADFQRYIPVTVDYTVVYKLVNIWTLLSGCYSATVLPTGRSVPFCFGRRTGSHGRHTLYGFLTVSVLTCAQLEKKSCIYRNSSTWILKSLT